MPRAILVSVVDDDQFFRDSMRRLVRSFGYRAEVFSSAADFLASPLRIETSCLICDVQMPEMSGFDLHNTLVVTGQAVPTILVTAYPNDIDRVRGLNQGVTCYLSKPISETKLIECVRGALAHHGDS